LFFLLLKPLLTGFGMEQRQSEPHGAAATNTST
jgi:hypothetical protein